MLNKDVDQFLILLNGKINYYNNFYFILLNLIKNKTILKILSKSDQDVLFHLFKMSWCNGTSTYNERTRAISPLPLLPTRVEVANNNAQDVPKRVKPPKNEATRPTTQVSGILYI
jgi:hypothetical protein